nr:hypothetical protein [Tanacetum cinerariifolium]
MIIVTESSVRRDLRLADEEGIDCLPNSTIFEQIALMGLKTTGWNEFSSIMASAIISLARNQKFNFSKFVFDSMIRNLNNDPGKFLVYPRNMRRVGKGFSGKVTPLLQIIVQQLGEGSAIPTDPQHTPTIIQPSSSQPQKTQKPKKPKIKDTRLPQPSGPTESVKDKVVHEELGDRVESYGDEESLGEDASKQGRRIDAIDVDEEITMVNVQDKVVSINANKEMFDVDVLGGEDVFVAGQNENVVEEVVDAAQVSTAATTVIITTEEITLAQALEALKTSKPKVKGIIFQELGKSTTTTTIISSQQSQDKGKGIMIEEPMKPKKKDQTRLDEEAAKKLQAEFDKEERLAR